VLKLSLKMVRFLWHDPPSPNPSEEFFLPLTLPVLTLRGFMHELLQPLADSSISLLPRLIDDEWWAPQRPKLKELFQRQPNSQFREVLHYLQLLGVLSDTLALQRFPHLVREPPLLVERSTPLAILPVHQYSVALVLVKSTLRV
jgi:hypothetical protein